ncbi:MAG: D-alanyl-D-alanine carboxypeptidase/D-alanyl-D-alanine-endopeptidase [Myxococcota bacterium]
MPGITALLALALWLGMPCPSGAGELAAPFRALRAEPALRGAQLGMEVVDLATGRSLYASAAHQPLIPASNQKLLIAAAALAAWGPAHRLETTVWLDGPIDASGQLRGTLWIEGSGDAGLVSESLWKLAERLRVSGLRGVRGGLGVDPHWLDAQYFHPDWAPVSSRAYHAPIAAFAVNYSSFRIEVHPGPALQAPARVEIAPAVDYLQVDSEARTSETPSRLQVDVEPLPSGSGDRVRVRGAIARGAEPRLFWRAVTQPGRYAASVLRSQLAAQGIHVAGPTRFGRVPASAREWLRFKGPPLSTLVRRMAKYSNNFIAEQLTKRLGAELYGPPGSWQKGRRALVSFLESEYPEGHEWVVRDGSGLSARDRLSAHTLVQLLRRVSESFRFGPEFLTSLPIFGRDGTLEERLDGQALPVRAKTGHIRRVATLSGYLSTRDGRRLAFSLLINGARAPAEDVDAAVDRWLVRLTDLGMGLAAPAGAPSLPGAGAPPRGQLGSR